MKDTARSLFAGLLTAAAWPGVCASAQAPTYDVCTLDGIQNEQLGRGLAVVPDYDGDGLADLAVGGPGLGGNSIVRVFSCVRGTPAVVGTLGANSSCDQLGFVLAGLGTDRVVVGSPGSSGGGNMQVACTGTPLGCGINQGQIRVFRPGSELFCAAGLAAGDQYGYAVAGLGDVDGDGFGDLVVGAPGGTP